MERELARLEDAHMRESTRWEEMKTPDRIERALLQHGLSMRPPRPEQTVRMTANGTPYPGQLSLARARQRLGAERTASVAPASVRTPTVKSRYRRQGRR